MNDSWRPVIASHKSTDVRIRLLRSVFAALQRVWPDGAARLAERLFFTPLPSRLSAGGAAFLATGTREDVEIGPSQQIATWRWGEGPVRIVVLHGWSSRAAHMKPVIEALFDAHRTVVAFDAPAHGESSGRRTSIPEFADAVMAVSEHLGPFDVVVGYSLGGAVAGRVLSLGLPAKAAVLLAPAAEGRCFALSWGELLGWNQATFDGMERRFVERLGVRYSDLELPRLAREFRSEALILHDEEDFEVPVAHGRAIAEQWPGARLETSKGLGHRGLVRDPAIGQRIARFVAETCPPPLAQSA